MLGFNWVDVVIVVLLLAAIVEGIRIGLLSQLFVIAGFFASLFLAGWLFPYIIRFHDPTLRTLVNAVLVLLTSTYVAIRCFDIGQSVHWSFRLGRLVKDHKLKLVESALGSVSALAAALVLVWLLGVMISRLPFVGLSNSVADASIIQNLTAVLPQVPAVFAEFDRHIDPNAQPLVSVPPKPQADFNYATVDVQLAADKAASSVVRITSFSCGGIVSGSGFAVTPDLVATNAHVIAGSQRPIVKYHGLSREGVPVYFDANLDVALLKVQGLGVPPLPLAHDNVALDTSVAVLGYPGGNYRVEPGIIRDTLATSGASIYDQGSFGRGLYQVQTHVGYGNSGGPVVLKSGRVAGIIFSKSTSVPDVAYALTSLHINDALRRAKVAQVRVSTGACMVN